MPAVLTETAFVDNKKDITDWNDDAELKKVGIAYAKAAAEFLKLKAKAPAQYYAKIGPFATKAEADAVVKALKTVVLG
jgi:hypothetical protein